jgi:NDP-sugar pyrophosphorylase family protein
MVRADEFIKDFSEIFKGEKSLTPWDITGNLSNLLYRMTARLDDNFVISDGIAVHRSAVIEKGVVLKAPVIIGEKCFIGAHAYLRAGVYLVGSCTIGPGCEIKNSIIFRGTTIAHFNFIGDSIIGSGVNFEAGSLTANHHNEREHKNIFAVYNDQVIDTGSVRFGALVGDNARIGANAVLSPGTLLKPGSIVNRLELFDQLKARKK